MKIITKENSHKFKCKKKVNELSVEKVKKLKNKRKKYKNNDKKQKQTEKIQSRQFILMKIRCKYRKVH